MAYDELWSCGANNLNVESAMIALDVEDSQDLWFC